MKKIQLFLVMLFVGIQTLSAQNMQITGKVTYADDGAPVIGATIKVKGTTTATISDVTGAYKITIPASAKAKVLEVSYTGLVPQSIDVNKSGVINIIMKTDAINVEAVVVTAYGSTRKKDFTGTAAVVTSKDVKNIQVTSPANALQGLATGVMVVNTNGQPGENATIRVRGIGTFTSSVTDANAGAPLIVLDGVTYSGNLNTIAPSDIESMTVLKDANSTALYGSRAANGVIMITTKSGVVGKARVTATASYGMSTRARKDYDYLGAEDYLKYRWEAMYNYAHYDNKKDADWSKNYASQNLIAGVVYNPYGPKYMQPIGTDGNVVAGATLLYDEDWYKALTQLGQRQQYDVAVSGGTESTQYMISIGTISEKAIIAASRFDRYNARAKVDTKVNNWLKVGLNSSIVYSDQNYPMQSGTNMSSITAFVRMMSNIYPAYQRDADGNLVHNSQGELIPDYGTATHPGVGFEKKQRPVAARSNPLGTTTLNDISYNRLMSSNNAYVEANFLKDFTFRSTLGVEYYLLNGNTFYNPLYGDGAAYNGLSRKERTINTTVSWVNALTWDKTFSDKHHVNVLVGMDSYDYRYNYEMAERQGLGFPGVTEIDYAIGAMGVSSNKTGTRNMRYMARANYDFDQRLHISASYTYDGTSRFSGPNKWGSFYSVGAAWNISSEKWFSDAMGDSWNNLKLRGSYGTSGNANIGYFPYRETYNTGWNIMGNAGAIVGRLGNNNLSWESQEQLDLGVDFGFLSGTLNFSATYFDRKSKDLLMARPLAPSSGVGSYYDNVGKIQNKGWEFEINATPFNRKDLQWTVGFNIAYLQNKVLDLPDNVAESGMNNPSSNYKRLSIGSSAYTWYLKEFAGIDPENGNPLWYMDVKDGDKVTGRKTTSVYGNATEYMIDDALPKWQGGLNTSFTYKGMDVGVVFSFSIGGKILDTDYAGLMHNYDSSRSGNQTVKEVENAWKNPGDVTDVARLTLNPTNFNSLSTRWLVDASYLRLRNFTVGYNFASLKGVKKVGFNNLRLYCAMDNLFTLCGTKGLDPEQGLDAITSNRSAAMRTISFGINIGF